jgi:SAM-dependent methyltransferase
MIQWLSENVIDERFHFAAMNTHNEKYNPTGVPLTPKTALPLENKSFALICLFSVFTHLAPHDFHAMLAMLRKYVKADGKLFFTLFLNEISPNGQGLMATMKQQLGAEWQPPTAPFTDLEKKQPLMWAVYSLDYVYELVAGTGWQIESLFDPEDEIQHHIICKPD